jgi:ubiquinone/menaquinone biosynthesis C-methylase UbiE
MPAFYNGAIDLAQRLALARWLRVAPGTQVLDVGCGVGRWSRRLARRGAHVTGVDLSPTMLGEARRRAEREGVAERCRFLEADLAALDLGRSFPLVLGVTVLQHVVEAARLEQAVGRLARHVAPGGRLVLLEAAPERGAGLESATFRARTVEEYRRVFETAGLRLAATTGVDPFPLKIRFLPRLRALPRPLGLGVLAALTALGLPVEVVAGRALTRSSWHKVFVLEAATP